MLEEIAEVIQESTSGPEWQLLHEIQKGSKDTKEKKEHEIEKFNIIHSDSSTNEFLKLEFMRWGLAIMAELSKRAKK